MPRKESDRRITATLDPDLYRKLVNIAERKGESVSDALRDAVDLLIRYDNEDYYPLARIEAARVNQMVDLLASMSSKMDNMSKYMVEGFTSILNVTNGDAPNYLQRVMDEDDPDRIVRDE